MIKHTEINHIQPATDFRITLLRHAQSIANQEGILQGQSDFPLSPDGEHQIDEMARYWKQAGVYFDQIFCSPLKRAHLTAQIIASTLRIPLVVDDIWMERSFGKGEGIPIEDLPNHVKRFVDRSPHDPLFEGAESDWDLFYRASQALHSILNHAPGSYLVVTHGGLMRACLDGVLGRLPGMAQRSVLRFHNLAWETLHYQKNRSLWTVLAPYGACPFPGQENL